MVAEGGEVGVVRLMNQDKSKSPNVVVHEHRSRRDMSNTQTALESHDVAIFQHEFGIFDGHDGKEIIAMMNPLTIPTIAVMHTVLSHPTPHQRYVMDQIIRRADALVTMTQSGKDKLTARYHVNASQIHVLAHGARPMSRTSHPAFRHELKTRPRILTWGLIGPGKGLEWVIDALSELSDLPMKPEYVIAGQTHPNVKLRDGEQYRESLIERIAEKNLQDSVRFIDRYLTEGELELLIASADVIVLPYDSIEQVTSGVLVEAAVAGKPIIATDFPHASEMLSDGSGVLVQQKDSSAIAKALRKILTDADVATQMKRQLEQKSNAFLWPVIGRRYLDLADSLLAKKRLAKSEYIAS